MAPAWFDDFANGLLSAQKLAAALIVLHTGEGLLGGAGGGWWGCPGDQALGHGKSDHPRWPRFLQSSFPSPTCIAPSRCGERAP